MPVRSRQYSHRGTYAAERLRCNVSPASEGRQSRQPKRFRVHDSKSSSPQGHPVVDRPTTDCVVVVPRPRFRLLANEPSFVNAPHPRFGFAHHKTQRAGDYSEEYYVAVSPDTILAFWISTAAWAKANPDVIAQVPRMPCRRSRLHQVQPGGSEGDREAVSRFQYAGLSDHDDRGEAGGFPVLRRARPRVRFDAKEYRREDARGAVSGQAQGHAWVQSWVRSTERCAS